jgi:uncharacterized RDD family membrane protein YckC
VRNKKTGFVEILTPEGVAFALPLAGPVSRFMAWFIDLGVISAAAGILNQLFAWLKVVSPDLYSAFGLMVFFIFYVGGPMAQEWFWRGQTVGKRLFKLRVADAQGLRLQSSQIFVRNILRFIDMLPLFYLVGGVACALNSRSQRLGDIAANTVVIRTPSISEPDLASLLRSKYNSLAEHPHLAASLRQLTSPALSNVALEALMRRDQFNPQARLEIFAEIAAAFRKLVAFPPEAVEHLPDEQYVRNAVEILRIAR